MLTRKVSIAYPALCLGFFIIGCSVSPPIANRDSDGSSIVCFGDSLTEGVGASRGHDYPALLSHALGVQVINAGVAGETTADGLKRLEKDVLQKDPKLVIVLFGGNDFLQHVPREEVFKSLDEMVRRIQEAGAMVVIVGVQSGFWGDAARADYARIAKRRQAAFIPNILDGIFSEPSLKSDSVHPNDAGYEKIAQRILKVIKPLLEER